MVEITGVAPHSPACRAKIRSGDFLCSIDGHDIADVLDYMFYAATTDPVLKLRRDGKYLVLRLRKDEYLDIGLEFKSFLMDEKQTCRNKCVFCFIDQMPPGMRETLYFKDDDARLSFLHGNYITLTNLTDSDIRRIIDMRLNINVSVHTTNPELRCRMMKNRFAGEKLRYLRELDEAGISLNCQIVLCPDLNDGAELRRTLDDLCALENINSVAVVPLGMTKYRSGLEALRPVDGDCAAETIDIISEYQGKMLEKHGFRAVFAADEFFLLAERELPPAEYYEDYPQYENGVGMLRLLEDEFLADAKTLRPESPVSCSIATGAAAFPMINALAEKLCADFPMLSCRVYKIRNDFFGESITVAGLVTGGDLIAQLRDRELGDYLLISSSMLRSGEELFLDDVTVDDAEKALGVPLRISAADGSSLCADIMNIQKGRRDK